MADRFREHQRNAPTPCDCHPSNKLNRKCARHALKEEDRRDWEGEPFKCGTWGCEISPEVRERMDADRAAAEAALEGNDG